MFIKRNTSKRGGKSYSSVLLVQGERVAQPRPPGRPRKGEKRQTKVVHRTLANLSKLPPALVALVERYCEAERRGEPLEVSNEVTQPVVGVRMGRWRRCSRWRGKWGWRRRWAPRDRRG
jgi:hypothetical protein